MNLDNFFTIIEKHENTAVAVGLFLIIIAYYLGGNAKNEN